MSGDSFTALRYSVEAGVGFITLARPPLNLIDVTLMDEYFAALNAADEDPEVKVLVLTGDELR